jgi:hypothetical protein
MVSEWPPSRSEFYLPSNRHRPLFQGDVFRDVPFVKARFNNGPSSDPNVTVERRMVAVIGFPCDLYQNGKPVKVQCVAPVVEASKVNIPPTWAGAYTHIPLPDLLEDGVMYAVSLQATANVDERYLVRNNRVASLSRLGWAVFRQRLALCSTRGMFILEDLDHGGAHTWEESELWTQWCAHGRPEEAFPKWLDSLDPTLGGFTRRATMERGMTTQVRGLLANELR